MLLCYTYKIENIKRVAISMITGILYATSDEIHQAFTPGRGPLFTDVLIDTMGVILGILLVMLVMKIFKQQTKVEKCNNLAVKCNK